MEPTYDSDLVLSELLTELASQEHQLMDMEKEYLQAQSRFEMASRKYATVRDMVIEHLGFSPYFSGNWVFWPAEIEESVKANKGKYRFIHMDAGEAVVAALSEVEGALTLEEIWERLRSGGFNKDYKIDMRTVNAALINTSRIIKKDGKYELENRGWYTK
jgi:hypothetical protein